MAGQRLAQRLAGEDVEEPELDQKLVVRGQRDRADNQRLGISYDNYNINGANSFGNLGIDWGYRLEFR